MSTKNTLIKYSLILFAGIIFSLPAAAGTGQITLINADSAGEGLNDPTTGPARLAAFAKAIEILNAKLDIDINIQVNAEFNPLFCTPTSAVLGSAGANGMRGFPNDVGSLQANTWYPIGLFNELQNAEGNNSDHEINATFNSNIGTPGCLQSGGWDYSFAEPAAGKTSFLSVVLHEIVHGLGFSSALGSDGSLQSNYFGIYDRNLKHNSTDITALSQSQRNTAIRSDDLYWSGTSVNNAIPGTAEMYAPAVHEPGSSVSHFAKVTTPDELMEPVYTSYMETIGLAANLLEDIGWTLKVVAPPPNNAPVFTSTNSLDQLYGASNSHTLSATDSENNALSFSLTNFNNAQLNVSLAGTNLSIAAKNNYTGNSIINVAVNDGTNTTAQAITVEVLSDFNLSHNSSDHANGAQVIGGFSSVPFTITGGDNSLTVALNYLGQDKTAQLLTKVGNNYQLAMPSSGAFAGTYTIDVQDSKGHNATYTIKRPTRLSSSHTQLLDASSDQYLYIEGAPANSILDLALLTGSSYLELHNNANTSISQVTILDDALSFNRTAVKLAAQTVTETESAQVQVDNVQIPAANKSFDILQSYTLNLKVVDSNNQAISSALLTITNDARVASWGLNDSVSSDNAGLAQLIIAGDKTPQIQTTATDYSAINQSYLLQSAEQVIQLSEIQNAVTISGTVSTDDLNFSDLDLSVVLIADDNNQLLAQLSNISDAQFDYTVTYDASSFTAASIQFKASTESSEKTISQQQDQTLNSDLNNAATTQPEVTPQPTKPTDEAKKPTVIVISSSGSGGGLMSWQWLVLLSSLLFIRKSLKK